MSDETRRIFRPGGEAADRSDVRRIGSRRETDSENETIPGETWVKRRIGKVAVVGNEEWMVIELRLGWKERLQTPMALVNKRTGGKVSSVEMPVEELRAMNLEWK